MEIYTVEMKRNLVNIHNLYVTYLVGLTFNIDIFNPTMNFSYVGPKTLFLFNFFTSFGGSSTLILPAHSIKKYLLDI